MKPKFGLVLAVWTLLLGLAAIPGSQVSAQGQAQQTAAQRCFERHQFGAQPVDVAKTTDGQTVLAQTSWNWHDSIGCYLTLDDDALAALRAAPPPQSLPNAPTEASRRCFEHHKFGENPVDVAKTTDGQTVLARLSWGYHSTFGCYLVLDDTALTTLRTAHTDSTPEPTPEPTPTTDDVPTDTDDIPTDTDTDATDIEIPQASPRFTRLATGVSYSCAIRTDQTIACWGNNQDGQIDAPHGQYTTIAVGDSHSCAIRTDQTIACWGNNDLHGYIGQADAPHGQYTTIAVGGFHSCAIRTDQTIACWGLSEYGIIDAPEGQFTAIAAGNSHSCAITTDQTIACWGNNRTGQTDAPPSRFAAMAIGDHHSCAIGIKGSIACWGSNRDGQADAPPGRYTAIAVGDHHSCAIKTDQTIACWGNNWQGLADAPEGQYTAIAAGDVHTCAIRTDQTITCWGNNQDGQADAPPGEYSAIAASAHWHGSHSCAIGVDQSIACWGYNQDGESSVPIRLRTPPEELLSVQVFSVSEPQVKAGGSFEVTVEFSRAVSGFDANDMNVVNGDVTHFSGSGSEYEATVTAAALGTVVVLIPRAAALDQNGRSNEPSQPFARTVRTMGSTALTSGDEFFDTWDRDAVRASASAEFHRKEPSHDWTGDIDKCVAGTTSQPYRDSIFQRVNWYRQMAGLNPVVERQEFSDSAQHAALIMAAEGGLSHSPPADWACYTPTGHEGASNSNLNLGKAGTSSIDRYIRDPGGGNVHVGHRRWILHPKAVEFGTGDIPSPFRGSNALYVVPGSREGSSKTREERGFVAWPPPGYFPPAVNWGRWSFSLSDAHYPADFSTASVEVSDEFGTLTTEVIHRDSTGIVWGMHGNADDGLVIGRRPLYSVAESNYCYTVTISGVKINDSVQTPYEYAVCVLGR